MERLVRRTRQIRPIRRIMGIAIVLTLAILGLATVSPCAPSVSAFLDAKRFSVDQSATLTITINDASGTIGELPVVDGLDFQRRGQSSQHQFVNGSLSSSVTTIFQVSASRPGTFTIPPLPITVDGKQLLTEPITFEVTSPAAGIPSLPNQQGGGGATPPPSGIQGAGDTGQMAFLRISPVKKESYSGELLPIEIKAYFRQGLRASLNSQPRLNGDSFVLAESRQEPVQTEEVVGNVPYSVLTWPATLAGIKEGRQTLSVAIDATLLLRDTSRRSARLGGDPFSGNDLFADFFNQQQLQEKKIRIVSKDVDLQVLPLPTEGTPAGFSGAIGRFELQVKAQPTDVGPGDPITLTMTVQGAGNFDRVDAPVLTQAEGWKSYPPSAKFTQGTTMGQGRKVFEQALIAKGADKAAIPPLFFSFFDPETRKYQTVHSDPIPLHISKAENGPQGINVQGPPAANADKTAPQKSHGDNSGRPDAGELHLAPQHSLIGPLQQGLIPLFARTGFQIVVLISLLLLVAVIFIKIRARRLASNPLLGRKREMEHLLDLRLREIREIQERGNSQEFLAACRKAMQEQLGLLWQTEPGAITLSDLRQRLARDAELIPLFTTAESGAYAGNLLSSQEMTEYTRKMENELRQLQ